MESHGDAVTLGLRDHKERAIIRDGSLWLEASFEDIRAMGCYQFEGIVNINGESIHFYTLPE